MSLRGWCAGAEMLLTVGRSNEKSCFPHPHPLCSHILLFCCGALCLLGILGQTVSLLSERTIFPSPQSLRFQGDSWTSGAVLGPSYGCGEYQ